MSYGRMKSFAELKEIKTVKDSEGFSCKVEVHLASFRCYREGRHGSRMWANLSSFSEATELFRFRAIPGVNVNTKQILICDNELFEIVSVETVKGRGLYVEVLAKKVVSAYGKDDS